MPINKKLFTKAIKKGVSAAGGYLAYSSTSRSKMKGDVADIKATAMFMKKIPTGLPEAVRKQARESIRLYVKAGNYVGARKYIAKLK